MPPGLRYTDQLESKYPVAKQIQAFKIAPTYQRTLNYPTSSAPQSHPSPKIKNKKTHRPPNPSPHPRMRQLIQQTRSRIRGKTYSKPNQDPPSNKHTPTSRSTLHRRAQNTQRRSKEQRRSPPKPIRKRRSEKSREETSNKNGSRDEADRGGGGVVHRCERERFSRFLRCRYLLERKEGETDLQSTASSSANCPSRSRHSRQSFAKAECTPART